MINVVAGVQIAGAALLGMITVIKFEPEASWFLLGCILTGLVAVGLIARSKLAFLTEFVLLFPVCGLLLFQTGRRVWGIFTGVWRDCPPAYIMGFVFEQAVLVPALCMGIVLLLCRSQFQKPQKMES